jgi:hypothetical protein
MAVMKNEIRNSVLSDRFAALILPPNFNADFQTVQKFPREFQTLSNEPSLHEGPGLDLPRSPLRYAIKPLRSFVAEGGGRPNLAAFCRCA